MHAYEQTPNLCLDLPLRTPAFLESIATVAIPPLAVSRLALATLPALS
jgi:hypothetical protein